MLIRRFSLAVWIAVILSCEGDRTEFVAETILITCDPYHASPIVGNRYFLPLRLFSSSTGRPYEAIEYQTGRMVQVPIDGIVLGGELVDQYLIVLQVRPSEAPEILVTDLDTLIQYKSVLPYVPNRSYYVTEVAPFLLAFGDPELLIAADAGVFVKLLGPPTDLLAYDIGTRSFRIVEIGADRWFTPQILNNKVLFARYRETPANTAPVRTELLLRNLVAATEERLPTAMDGLEITCARLTDAGVLLQVMSADQFREILADRKVIQYCSEKFSGEQFVLVSPHDGPRRLSVPEVSHYRLGSSGSYIVYADDRYGEGHRGVFVYNLESDQEVALTTSRRNADCPAIKDDRVIFLDFSHPRKSQSGPKAPLFVEGEYYLHDLSTGTQRCVTCGKE